MELSTFLDALHPQAKRPLQPATAVRAEDTQMSNRDVPQSSHGRLDHPPTLHQLNDGAMEKVNPENELGSFGSYPNQARTDLPAVKKFIALESIAECESPVTGFVFAKPNLKKANFNFSRTRSLGEEPNRASPSATCFPPVRHDKNANNTGGSKQECRPDKPFLSLPVPEFTKQAAVSRGEPMRPESLFSPKHTTIGSKTGSTTKDCDKAESQPADLPERMLTITSSSRERSHDNVDHRPDQIVHARVTGHNVKIQPKAISPRKVANMPSSSRDTQVLIETPFSSKPAPKNKQGALPQEDIFKLLEFRIQQDKKRMAEGEAALSTRMMELNNAFETCAQLQAQVDNLQHRNELQAEELKACAVLKSEAALLQTKTDEQKLLLTQKEEQLSEHKRKISEYISIRAQWQAKIQSLSEEVRVLVSEHEKLYHDKEYLKCRYTEMGEESASIADALRNRIKDQDELKMKLSIALTRAEERSVSLGVQCEIYKEMVQKKDRELQLQVNHKNELESQLNHIFHGQEQVLDQIANTWATASERLDENSARADGASENIVKKIGFLDDLIREYASDLCTIHLERSRGAIDIQKLDYSMRSYAAEITQALERVYNATVSTTSHAHENVQLKQCIELLQKKLDEITTSSVATTAQRKVKLQEATIRIETTEAQARELEEMLTIATENYNNEAERCSILEIRIKTMAEAADLEQRRISTLENEIQSATLGSTSKTVEIVELRKNFAEIQQRWMEEKLELESQLLQAGAQNTERLKKMTNLISKTDVDETPRTALEYALEIPLKLNSTAGGTGTDLPNPSSQEEIGDIADAAIEMLMDRDQTYFNESFHVDEHEGITGLSSRSLTDNAVAPLTLIQSAPKPPASKEKEGTQDKLHASASGDGLSTLLSSPTSQADGSASTKDERQACNSSAKRIRGRSTADRDSNDGDKLQDKDVNRLTRQTTSLGDYQREDEDPSSSNRDQMKQMIEKPNNRQFQSRTEMVNKFRANKVDKQSGDGSHLERSQLVTKSTKTKRTLSGPYPEGDVSKPCKKRGSSEVHGLGPVMETKKRPRRQLHDRYEKRFKEQLKDSQ